MWKWCGNKMCQLFSVRNTGSNSDHQGTGLLEINVQYSLNRIARVTI